MLDYVVILLYGKNIDEEKGINSMKKLIKLVMVIVAISSIGVAAKVTVSANEKQVEVAEDSMISDNNEESNDTDIQGQNDDETFTCHHVFEKMEYITYCKGHNVPHTLVYSVNGGEKITDSLKLDCEDIRSGIPHYMMYYYDFPNVKVGDVIEYEYSYTYRYGGFPEERAIPGTFVVEAPTE